MAPTQTFLLECPAEKGFFENVSRENYPPPRSKKQPWKIIHTDSDPTKVSQADGKMVVACGLRHDYGKFVSPTSQV